MGCIGSGNCFRLTQEVPAEVPGLLKGLFRSGRRLKEHQPDDQRKQEPENKAPQEGDRPTEVAFGGVRAASGRLIHWPSIAYLAVGLAQLAWIILLIYATYWLLAIRL